MRAFRLPKEVVLVASPRGEPCYDYAVSELRRLLGRLNVQSRRIGGAKGFVLALGTDARRLPRVPSVRGVTADGYVLAVQGNRVAIAALTAKGVLNGVYDLAERLGFLFLLPGEAGEWTPTAPRGLAARAGTFRVNPRFKYRGVFWESLKTEDYTVEEWLAFYAKLRFNALSHHIEDRALARKLGLRLEVGGHGLSALLPRKLFETKPDLFRMAQPEDFGGRRTSQSNLCVTSPEAKAILKRNYARLLRRNQGAYAVHAWADDLPGGGWCLCPSCRAFSPPDQAALAMRHLAEAVREQRLPQRVPMIAYHDTMVPGQNLDPVPENFLLFAPRERCYGHALDDPACARNRFYLGALEQWTDKCRGIDDAHTFEYYFDQILFRGLYPFLPGVIVRDLAVYAVHGIEASMSLQVAGPAVAPEFNMLVFAQAQWDGALSTEGFIRALARRIDPAQPEVWEAYLTARAEAFTAAMRMCEYDCSVYMDYRWLPETTGAFGKRMVSVYARASRDLAAAARRLAAGDASLPRVKRLMRAEAGRARFEAAELAVMADQQTAVNGYAEYQNTGDRAVLRRAIAAMDRAIRDLASARRKAAQARIPPASWYFGNINGWLSREFAAKAKQYRKCLGKKG